MKTKVLPVIIAGILAVSMSVTVFAADDKEKPAEKVISVAANEVVKGTLDIADVSVGITEIDELADVAQSKVEKKLDSILNALSDIDEEKISVSGFNIVPEYDYNDESYTYKEIIKYNVGIKVDITQLSTEEAGEVISKCVEAGANEVFDVVYTCSNYQELYNQALEKAVERAHEKAEILANAGNCELGDVVRIAEGYENTTYRNTNSERSYAKNVTMDSANEMSYGIELSPEDADISATVTVIYSIKE